MTEPLDDYLDDDPVESGLEYGDRLELGFAILAGRELDFDLPEDSNGADYELDELGDSDDE